MDFILELVVISLCTLLFGCLLLGFIRHRLLRRGQTGEERPEAFGGTFVLRGRGLRPYSAKWSPEQRARWAAGVKTGSSKPTSTRAVKADVVDGVEMVDLSNIAVQTPPPSPPPSPPSADAMKAAAAASTPFDDAELDTAVASLKAFLSADEQSSIEWGALRDLYARRAHLSHKDWSETEQSANSLAKILGGPDNACFRKIFARVLDDGNFDGAANAFNEQPWIVLVTGLNGIRKTTSCYQRWFPSLLAKALTGQMPSDQQLPTGQNSFFRQLDYMIATLALEHFKTLYTLDDVQVYSDLKAGIFARYRTIAEMLGVLLVREAQSRSMNIMVETSGRDVGMYQYIDHLFPDGKEQRYRKLVLNFTISDIRYAEVSVDGRMKEEMAAGREALAAADPIGIVKANAGGPYGSSVLAGVQADSQKVWERIVAGGEASGGVGQSWLKASIRIEPNESPAPWTASAVIDGAGEAERYAFVPPSR